MKHAVSKHDWFPRRPRPMAGCITAERYIHIFLPPRPLSRRLQQSPQDAETVGRLLAQVDKCNGYILGAHDTAIAQGASAAGSVSNLFRTAFSDTQEPMFEKVGSVQERYMPETYGSVPPELLMNGTPEARLGLHTGRGASAERRSEEPAGGD